ncbi:MAG: ribonuclease H-like domain-containing protein [Clostridia bacterium]|nr:ribonuclease H-like domain-containing protein [Clostridia bacterium]
MLSLRDKLKAAAGPKPAAQKKPLPLDCMVRQTRTALSCFALPQAVSGTSLELVQGTPCRDFRREDICFLDTETTGLSHGAGTVAFLVGVGYFDEAGFVVRQYLMRDYDEEPLLLSHVAEEMAKGKILCTFNGATFDLPLLETRFTMQRMREMYVSKPHVDLLPASRRVWKLRLKHCNLSSLEEAVLGMRRQDDLPGALVPERYFSFLKTGDFSLLEDVLAHNAQDIISLAHILDRLIRLHDAPLLAEQPEDLFSLGRVYEKRGRAEGARMCYRAADRGSMSILARGRMAETYRREGNYAEAAQIYRRMAADRQGGAAPLIALAKICEHKTKDIPAAVEYTRRAIILAADQPGSDMAALQRRYERLMKKARRQD